ncbi:MAG: SH3 domain-containing protein [Chloroflexi bacterium]|nr:SH3 domain-containing protein [Chloroflexota bacterium]
MHVKIIPSRLRTSLFLIAAALLLSGALAPALAALNTNFEAYAAGTRIAALGIPNVTFTSAPVANSFQVLGLGGAVGAPLAGNILANSQAFGDPPDQDLTVTFTGVAQTSYTVDWGTLTGFDNFQIEGRFGGATVFIDNFVSGDPPPYHSATAARPAGVVFDQLILTTTSAEFAIDNFITADVAMIFTQTGGSTDVAEAGPTSDTYDVALNGIPSANVVINLTTDGQCTVLPNTLTFTPGNYNVAQTVTVTAVDDAAIEGPHTCVITHTIAAPPPEYVGVGPSNIVANVTDNDFANVTITESGGSTDIAEAGPTNDTYTVVLTGAPSANVIINITPDAQCTVAPAALTFTPGNYNVAQTVTVTAVDDLVVEGPHTCTITHAVDPASAPEYIGLAIADVVANVTDNDFPPGVTITESGGATDVSEAGPTNDTYTVVLDSAPSANVIIDITPDAQCTVAPAALTFTPGNYNVAQTVTVTAVDDALVEGPHTCTITHAVRAGSAPEYIGLAIADVVANVTDNDVAGVTITESGGATDVSEAGPTNDTYTVVLNTLPSANVIINITPDAQCTVAPVTLTFTPANYNILQLVTVTAVDDAVPEASPHPCVITHAVDPASALEYIGVAIADVTANVTDNDAPGVTVSPNPVNIAEGGAAGNYQINLNTLPAGAVTITVTPNAQCDVGAGGGVPIDIVLNDTTPQNIPVTAVDDAIVEGAHTCVITHAITATGDPADYPVGLPIANKIINIADNDGAPPSGPVAAPTAAGFPPPPPLPLCADIGGTTNAIVRASVPADTVPRGSVFCRVIAENTVYIEDPAEVGNAAVFSLGVIQAVDVFGLSREGRPVVPFQQGVTVCLLGNSGMIFLDAATAPRVPQWLATSFQGGYTCGVIFSSGTVVLVATPSPVVADVSVSAPVQELAGCRVTTTAGSLRLRKEANTGSPIIALLGFNETFDATARQGIWFRINAAGATGWVNGGFLNLSGNCGG